MYGFKDMVAFTLIFGSSNPYCFQDAINCKDNKISICNDGRNNHWIETPLGNWLKNPKVDWWLDSNGCIEKNETISGKEDEKFKVWLVVKGYG